MKYHKHKISYLLFLFVFLYQPTIVAQLTTPPYLGEFLMTNNYEYQSTQEPTQNAKAAYLPNNLIILWEPDVPENQKIAIREANQVVHRECICGFIDNIELWEGINGVNINEKVSQSDPESEIRSMGLNYYLFDELSNDPLEGIADMPILSLPNYITLPPPMSGQILVAVLDTGIDYEHPELQPYLWYDQEEVGVFNDPNDNNTLMDCLDDPIGYNFAYGNNNPNDDHSHGTHVAGTIVECLDPNQVKLLNVKTHDNRGVSTLFSIVCGVYYALHEGANIINASWGYYGDASPVLRDAIIDAGIQNVLVCAAAGNDDYDVGDPMFAHYPSGYNLPNIISVGAIDKCDDSYWDYSNYSNTKVHIAASGVDINSTMPTVLGLPDHRGLKSGTSMATPVVSALGTMEYQIGVVNPYTVKMNIFNDGISVPALIPLVNTGKKACINKPPFGQAMLSAKVFLEGFYDIGTGTMHDNLRTNGAIPSTSPYDGTTLPDPTVLQNHAVVDWIFVRLLSACDSTLSLDGRSALLLKDGNIVDLDGLSPLVFNVPYDEYYIEIQHRNHLPIRSLFPFLLKTSNYIYDFSNGNLPLNIGQHSAQKTITGNVLTMFTGNADSNGQINQLDYFSWFNCSQGGASSGYFYSDFNGDGHCDDLDILLWKNNVGKGKYY